MKDAPYQPSGEVRRIISLDNGSWAYLFTQHGKTLHIRRDSEEFVTACKSANEALNGRIIKELELLEWFDVIEKMGEDENGQAAE
jgi:hypothetical protein